MLNVYAVRDVKADAFESLICCATSGLVVRAFADACADGTSPMGRYPADYTLYQLGTYEPNAGEIKGLPTPKYICSVNEALQSKRIAEASAAPVATPVPEVAA